MNPQMYFPNFIYEGLDVYTWIYLKENKGLLVPHVFDSQVHFIVQKEWYSLAIRSEIIFNTCKILIMQIFTFW